MDNYDDLIAHARGLATADVDLAEEDDDDMGDDGDIDLDDPELLVRGRPQSPCFSESKQSAYHAYLYHRLG